MKVSYTPSSYVDEEIYLDHLEEVFRISRDNHEIPVLHLQDGHVSRSGWSSLPTVAEHMEKLNVRNSFVISHTTTWSQTNDRGFSSPFSIQFSNEVWLIFFFWLGVNRKVDAEIRRLTKEALNVKKAGVPLQPEGIQERFECRLNLYENFEVICQALLHTQNEALVFQQAYRDTCMLGPVNNWTSFYERTNTWQDGSFMRGEKCVPVTKEYLLHLFKPLNLAQRVEAPMVLPLSLFEEKHQKSWTTGRRKKIHHYGAAAVSQEKSYSLITFLPHWVKTAPGGPRPSHHSWKTNGEIVHCSEEVLYLCPPFLPPLSPPYISFTTRLSERLTTELSLPWTQLNSKTTSPRKKSS